MHTIGLSKNFQQAKFSCFSLYSKICFKIIVYSLTILLYILRVIGSICRSDERVYNNRSSLFYFDNNCIQLDIKKFPANKVLLLFTLLVDTFQNHRVSRSHYIYTSSENYKRNIPANELQSANVNGGIKPNLGSIYRSIEGGRDRHKVP